MSNRFRAVGSPGNSMDVHTTSPAVACASDFARLACRNMSPARPPTSQYGECAEPLVAQTQPRHVRALSGRSTAPAPAAGGAFESAAARFDPHDANDSGLTPIGLVPRLYTVSLTARLSPSATDGRSASASTATPVAISSARNTRS